MSGSFHDYPGKTEIKRTPPLIILLLLCAGLQAESKTASNEVPLSKHAVCIELLGRGLLGGIYYEHALWNNVLHTQISLGAGVGIMPEIGAWPMIYPPPPSPPLVLPIIPIYINIIPQIHWLQPQSKAVRFYFEPGIWLPQLFSRGYLAAGVRFKKNSTGPWGRIGVLLPGFPSFTLGWAF